MVQNYLLKKYAIATKTNSIFTYFYLNLNINTWSIVKYKVVFILKKKDDSIKLSAMKILIFQRLSHKLSHRK